jgi:hypothetical protein
MPRAFLTSAVAALAIAVLPAAAGAAEPLLPDLDQEAPSQLDVAVLGTPKHPDFRLGFRSAVRNIGAGPFIIDGHRAPGNPTMTADQLVERDDGTEQVVRGVGRLRYVDAITHQHWHLLHFDRYELRKAGSSRALVRDRKSGFCLGDRYQVLDPILPNAAPAPVFTSNCGPRQPDLLNVREGISVGYGDDYGAHIEFQDLPLTNLRNGRYVLVHRVNETRALRERNYDNDAASMLLDLRWRKGLPNVRILRTCRDTARCDQPIARAATASAVPVEAASEPRLYCTLHRV